MEKYGVLHEYRCECGYCVVMGDSQFHIDAEHIKSAGVYETGHVHKLVMVPEGVDNGNETEGGMLQPERPGSEA